MRHPLNTPIGRFGIDTQEDSAQRCVSTIPLLGLVNPITGMASLSPLAVLLDHAGGLVNHRRRGDGEWTLSSELSLDLSPNAAAEIAAAGNVPVLAIGRPLGAKEASAVAECDFTIGDIVIGAGTVRSFYVEAPDAYAPSPDQQGDHEAKVGLAAMMAVDPGSVVGAEFILPQRADPVLNNSIGITHGGIASAGLEIIASATLNAGRTDDPLTTASIRVNFLRPFFAGDQSRYVGTALRVGRRSGVAESTAIGADGKAAIIARTTAYRC